MVKVSAIIRGMFKSPKDSPQTGLSHDDLPMVRRCIFAEQEGQLFFESLAARYVDDGLRSEFLKIAADCKRHSDKLMDIYHGESQVGPMPAFDSDVVHLLEHHLDLEEEIDRFYEEMAASPRLDQRTRLDFATISADEKSHHANILSLMRTLEPSKRTRRS